MPPTAASARDGEALDADTEQLTMQGKPYKRHSIVACTGCRSIKVKCRLPNGNAPTGEREIDQSKCARCVRLDFDCQYKSAPRRGRRPKEYHSVQSQSEAPQAATAPALDPTNARATAGPSNLAAETTSVQPPRSGALPASPTPSASSVTGLGSLFPPHPLPDPPAAPQQQPNPPVYPAISQGPPSGFGLGGPFALGQSSPALSGGMRQSPASLTSLAGESRIGLSFADAAQAHSSTFSTSNLDNSARQRPSRLLRLPDPVDLWILSEAEAQSLVTFWHKCLNPYVILLDRHLHTYAYLRAHSSILFTAMLATAAKFVRRELYQRLLEHAQNMITRGMGGDVEPDIGLLQAILLLVYWKEPMDSSAWMRVGYAIRLAYQLRLHQRRCTPLPSDELEARVILDRERTWIALICFDNSYTMHEEDCEVETRMITSWKCDIDAWLRETLPYGVLDDAEQGVSIGLIQTGRLIRAIKTAPSKSSAHAVAVRVHEIILSTHAKYFEVNVPNFTPLQGAAAHKARFHVVSARFGLAEACLAAAGLHDQVVLADAIVQAGELVACFEEAANTILLYVQDTIALEMLGFGQWIGRIFPHVTTSYQTTLVSYLTQIYLAATRAQRDHGGEAGGFIARFFRGALRALHPDGAPVTRPASPFSNSRSLQADAVTAAEPPNPSGPFDQLSGIEPAIFTDLDSLFADLRNDTSYWDSLNPTLATSTWAWLDEAFAPQVGAGMSVGPGVEAGCSAQAVRGTQAS
ncbi:hypothetical protein JCM3774_006340 [Rhodotorula dairenensis]